MHENWLLCFSFCWLEVALESATSKAFRSVPGSASDVRKNATERQYYMEVHEIIGDILDDAPMYPLEVGYIDDYNTAIFKNHEVDYGNIFEPSDCASLPTFIKWPADPKTFYTLTLLGLDYPTRGNRTDFIYWNHWLVGNIPGSNWKQGEVLAKYIGPHFKKGAGFHRFVFILYNQPEGRINFTEPRLDDKKDNPQRAEFILRNFVVDYGLRPPIAANFFFTP